MEIKNPLPEKYIFNILCQLGIEFENEKVFPWLKSKRYDFYFVLDSKKYIIETHGLQHYEESFMTKSLLKEQENDRIKRQSALSNGINEYIIIDCRQSNFDFIKGNVINSNLAKLFDLSNINWQECEEYCCHSLVKEVSELWENGITDTQKISELMKIDKSTTIKYLKIGKRLNWCSYNSNLSKEIKRKSIICLENQKVFTSAREVEALAEELFGFTITRGSVRQSCKNKIPRKGLNFRYIENK